MGLSPLPILKDFCGELLDREEQLQHARYKRWVEIDWEQAQVWRYAWDLLLQDRPTLEDICEALFARGYWLRDGRPFVRVTKRGKRVPNKQALSRVFHNWFYAGWVVAENDWANIPPKPCAVLGKRLFQQRNLS